MPIVKKKLSVGADSLELQREPLFLAARFPEQPQALDFEKPYHGLLMD
jgi:hypothetical protein